jgi:putative hydrolase of the HAD superfamily
MARVSGEVVLFDAGGTLFEVRGSVGTVYARAASAHGLELDPSAVDSAFASVFRRQPPLAFGGLAGAALEVAERDWWRRVVADVFERRMDPTAFGRCFDDLWDYFGRPEAWRIFEDVAPELDRLRSAGYRLGVVSNFDSRLDRVLQGLGIAALFEHVAVSSRAGAAKPDPRIFRSALAAFSVGPRAAWHLGDVPGEDVEGARAAGVRPILLDRPRQGSPAQVARIGSLAELSGWIR